MINTKVRKALIRGTAVTLLTVIMASAAVGCGKKEEPASQAPVQEESAGGETNAEEPVDPEKVNEEAMEAIKEEEAGEDKNEAAVTETEKKTDEKTDEKTQDDKQEPSVIEKPEPSGEEEAEQEEDKEDK